MASPVELAIGFLSSCYGVACTRARVCVCVGVWVCGCVGVDVGVDVGVLVGLWFI